MGLNFSYKIYVKKEKLKDTFKYIYNKCSKDNSPIKYENDRLYKIENPHLSIEKQKQNEIKDLIEERFIHGFNFYFERDNKILEYKLKGMCDFFIPGHEYSDKPTLTDKSYLVGNIDISIEDYSTKIDGFAEISFTAVTSEMSILFKESKSIELFFQNLCKEVDAKYGCLDKEHEGYRLIWFEEEKYSVNLPNPSPNSNNQLFRKYGFIPTIKMILKKNKN